MDIQLGDSVYCFVGELIVCFTVSELVDDIRVSGEDKDCSYCIYREHCYHSKEDAIRGMLDALRCATECDCGEDEEEIESILYDASRKFG